MKRANTNRTLVSEPETLSKRTDEALMGVGECSRFLTNAIRHLRETHTNNYSWNLTISDEDAIDILYTKLATLGR